MMKTRSLLQLSSLFALAACACAESEAPPPSTPAAETPTAPKYSPPIMPAYSTTSSAPASSSGPPELKGGPGSRPSTTKTDPPRERVGSARVSAPSVSGQVANAETVTSGLRASFGRCYDNGLEADPKAEGTLVLALSVGKDGSVSRVESTAKGSVPSAVADCIKGHAKSAQFSPPSGGSAIVSIGVTLEKVNAAEGAGGPDSDAVTVAPAGGFPESEKVAVFVRAHARDCYRKALNIDPKAEGRLTVTVTIDEKGVVTAVQATSNGKLPDTLASCVEKKAKRAQFARPSAAPATVTIPIALSLKPMK